MVRQEYAARADANLRSFGGDPGDQNLTNWIGECNERVVLGEPVAMIAERIPFLRELDRFLYRLRRRWPLRIGRER